VIRKNADAAWKYGYCNGDRLQSGNVPFGTSGDLQIRRKKKWKI